MKTNQTVADRRQQFRAEQIRERINLRQEEAQAASGSKIGEIARGGDLGNLLRLAAQTIEAHRAGCGLWRGEPLNDALRAQSVAHEHDRIQAERDALMAACRAALAEMDRLSRAGLSVPESPAAIIRAAIARPAGQKGGK